MLDLILGNVWPVLIAIVGGIAAWFGIKAKRANTKAQEAIDRAEAAEDQAAQAEYRETHTRSAVNALERELNKPMPKPAKDRSDFEKPTW